MPRTDLILHDDPWDDRCVCGCPFASCPDCADLRCLHCDPLCAPESSCHDTSTPGVPASTGEQQR